MFRKMVFRGLLKSELCNLLKRNLHTLENKLCFYVSATLWQSSRDWFDFNSISQGNNVDCTFILTFLVSLFQKSVFLYGSIEYK